jgi:hypothetical protein
MTPKRQEIEKLVTSVMSILDPSGTNTNKYLTMFKNMTDQQFTKWMNEFLKSETSNFRLDIEEFGPDNRKLMYQDIIKAADFLKIKLFEYVYTPHVSEDPNRPVRTRQPVMVGYINIKRPQQLVTKKTGLVATDTNRDDMTGAAKGDSKGGTTSGIENELLAGVGADEIISEISGARGDNVVEYDNMISSISETGSVKLSDIKTSAYDKPTLLKTDIFLRAMGYKTDIVSESYYSIDKVRAALNK